MTAALEALKMCRKFYPWRCAVTDGWIRVVRKAYSDIYPELYVWDDPEIVRAVLIGAVTGIIATVVKKYLGPYIGEENTNV